MPHFICRSRVNIMASSENPNLSSSCMTNRNMIGGPHTRATALSAGIVVLANRVVTTPTFPHQSLEPTSTVTSTSALSAFPQTANSSRKSKSFGVRAPYSRVNFPKSSRRAKTVLISDLKGAKPSPPATKTRFLPLISLRGNPLPKGPLILLVCPVYN